MSRVKQPQVLQITPPQELSFKGPFNEVVTSTLNLHNPSDRKVCFKVKTTAPRRYCVRPNSGFVEPNESVNVSVMLQPIEGDANDKGKHKFMVQSMYATDACEELDKIWAQAEPGDLMDSKLKCVFIEPCPQDEEEPAPQQEETPPQKPQDEPQNTTKAQQDSTELKLLMEECKRLQLDNKNLKQLVDQSKSQPGSQALMQSATDNLWLVIAIMVAVFGCGIMAGIAI